MEQQVEGEDTSLGPADSGVPDLLRMGDTPQTLSSREYVNQ